jgi:hypothetical protein
LLNLLTFNWGSGPWGDYNLDPAVLTPAFCCLVDCKGLSG